MESKMEPTETDPVLVEETPVYGTSKNPDDEIIVPEEVPEVQAAFMSLSANSMFEYCCRGNLLKIIIILLSLTIFFFLCTVVLLTMVIMYATYQWGCDGHPTVVPSV